MAKYIRANGRAVINMEKDNIYGQMVIAIKECIDLTRDKVSE
jgi:hypothetical protein